MTRFTDYLISSFLLLIFVSLISLVSCEETNEVEGLQYAIPIRVVNPTIMAGSLDQNDASFINYRPIQPIATSPIPSISTYISTSNTNSPISGYSSYTNSINYPGYSIPTNYPNYPGYPNYQYPATTTKQKYYTTKGDVCTQVNYKDIPSTIISPDYCNYINYPSSFFNLKEKELCAIFDRIKENFQTLGSYRAIQILRDAWNLYKEDVRYLTNPPVYINRDPFVGCLPIEELPTCFQQIVKLNEQSLPNIPIPYPNPRPYNPSATPTIPPIPNPSPMPPTPNPNRQLPLKLSLLEICEDRPRRGRQGSVEISQFCTELKRIKVIWDRDGPISTINSLQELWKKYERKIIDEIDEEIPFYYKSYY